MDAYDQHSRFCKETGSSVNQSNFVNAFQSEYDHELTRLKQNGTIKRETSKARSLVSEGVYNRMLQWYNCKDNPLLVLEISRKDFYHLVACTRYAALFMYTLKYCELKE